jgi:hypothetical protein
MSDVDFRWVKPPEAELLPNIQAHGDRVWVAVRALADYLGQKMQGEARQHARWEDRTGNARSGLFGAVDEAAADIVDIYLSHGHTVYYGLFLEVCHGGKYAIIMPTIEANLPVAERMLKQILG